MAKVTFKRYETDAEAQNANVVDGQFIVTAEGTSYTDYGTERIAFGGLSYNEILNFIYPVGSYYETSDTTFNPNTVWGGTWVLDSEGKVTVSQDTNDTDFDTVGETGGEKTHTLTTDEIPSHNHSVVANTVGGSGTIQVNQGNYANVGNPVGTITIGNTGGGEAHNNLQPYIVVKRWHRTA